MISRHKRWHVWNQDNIKRVRDDEAKHAAEVEDKERKEKHHLNEQSLEILRREANIDDEIAPSSSSSSLDARMAAATQRTDASTEERFSLFEDPNLASSGKRVWGYNDQSGFDKEEDIKKKKIMIANGMQPWSFDDVTTGLKPWYSSGSASTENFPTEADRMNIRGKEIIGEEAEMARQRDHLRKGLRDPMAHIMKNSHGQVVSEVISNRLNTKVCNAFSRGEICKYGDSCRYLHGVDNEIYPTIQRISQKEELVALDSSSELSSSSS